eukprot:m.156213 g.156213  ORF g.156213 m.156213 type:complete len:71 (+) comp10214_c0_seq5:757-969(+)
MVSLLLQHGMPIDRTGNNGWTALHYAAEYQHPGVVTMLIAEGASPQARDLNGKCPYDYARTDELRDLLQY